jgi:hypothetical protein
MNRSSTLWIGLSALTLAAVSLCGCQSAQQRRAELVRICSDPANRRPAQGNLYYDECLAIHPLSSTQLRNDYLLNAPSNGE